MDNRKILSDFLDKFDKNEVEPMLGFMTEDVSWNILEDQHLVGKENLRKFFTENKDMKIVKATRDHFIVEGDRASVGGEVLCKNEGDGHSFEMYYTDVYELQQGKIKDMVTYIVMKKK